MKWPVNWLLEFFYHVGAMVDMLYRTLRSMVEFRRAIPYIVQQLDRVGVGSIPIVALTSSFVGMVAAVQTAYQLKSYVPPDLIGAGIWKAISIEFAPVFTAVVVAGRVGAGIAAELGTMRVSEQIDALEVMAINPYRFLVLPRLIAMIISMPLLTVLSMAISIFSALAISRLLFDMDVYSLVEGMKSFYSNKDLFGAIVKALVFGVSTGIVSAYFGFNTRGGAVGVGKATTLAVMVSIFMILFFDYLLGVLIFG